MSDATLPLKEKIAIVFDFDETLSPPTHLKMLEKTGIDAEEREAFVKKLLDDGWEKILARAWSWIRYSHAGRPTIKRQLFQEIGQKLELYEGVDTLFERLRGFCPHSIEMEFYLLTAGFVEIPQATTIAHEFTQIWGGEYAFNEQDELVFVKSMITHQEKRQYLLQLAKGTGIAGPNTPADTHQHVDEEKMNIPFSQIIYVGDGSSDRPAFSLMHEKGGISIGLAKDGSGAWKEDSKLKKQQKVDNLLVVDYTEGSELMQCLQLAVESICKRILLRRTGK